MKKRATTWGGRGKKGGILSDQAYLPANPRGEKGKGKKKKNIHQRFIQKKGSAPIRKKEGEFTTHIFGGKRKKGKSDLFKSRKGPQQTARKGRRRKTGRPSDAGF